MIHRIRGYLIVGSQYEINKPIVIVMIFDLYLFLSTGCSSDYEIVAQKPNIDPADITTCDFKPIETTRFHEYSCNPILQEELWGQGIVSVGFSVTEVQGHPFYQIWYNSSDIENLSYGLGYAVSTDGTNWYEIQTQGSDWLTKTTTYTAFAGDKIFADTQGGAFTITLPATAAVGDEIRFVDLANTFDTANLTIGRNSHKIDGATSDLTVATEGAGFALVYSGATYGWKLLEK